MVRVLSREVLGFVLWILQMRYVFQTRKENNPRIKELKQSDLHFLLPIIHGRKTVFFLLKFPLVFCNVSPRCQHVLLFSSQIVYVLSQMLLVYISIKLLGQTNLEMRHWNSHSFYLRVIPVLQPDHNSNYLAQSFQVIYVYSQWKKSNKEWFSPNWRAETFNFFEGCLHLHCFITGLAKATDTLDVLIKTELSSLHLCFLNKQRSKHKLTKRTVKLVFLIPENPQFCYFKI